MTRVTKTTVEFEGRTRERYSLVDETEVSAWPAELREVGRRQPRLEGIEKVTGTAQYTSDVRLPGLLWARVLRCPHPRARVTRIGVARARALDGVHAVLTYQDVSIEWDGEIRLLDVNAHFSGDEVAVVVAETESIAEDALRLIEVEYEALPFAIDADSALAPGAPAVRADRGNRAGNPQEYQRGDFEQALTSSGTVIQATYRTQIAVQNALEPHGTVAWWQGSTTNPADARLTVYESTQGMFAVRSALARWLELPLNRVDVVTEHMGGGFGAKQDAGKHTLLAAILSRLTGRPVYLMLDRKGENLAAGYRAPTIQHVRIAADRDGNLTALDAAIVAGIGAYRVDPMEVAGPYREMYACANLRTRLEAAYTNTGPSSAFRAPGYVEGAFALESAVDELAQALGIDPLDLRRRNDAQRDPVTGRPYSAKRLDECYQIGAELIDWARREQLPQEQDLRRGIGMASVVWGGGGGPPAYALVKIDSDGGAAVLTGVQDIGTGTRTALAQIAAEELGIPLGAVAVHLGETTHGLYAPTSAGSMTLSSLGPAVRTAASDARSQLLEIAATMVDAAPSELSIEEGHIVSQRSGERYAIRDLARRVGELAVVGRGLRGPNPSDVRIRTFAAQFVQVAVDVVTGRVRVERVVSVHDAGRIINPMTADSQVIGGVIQGIGYATMEQQVHDGPTGRVLNPNLEEYKLPTALDTPDIVVRFIDRPDAAANNIGAKGIGEPPIVGVPAAVANAVAAATGVRIRTLPLSPPVVLAALKERRP